MRVLIEGDNLAGYFAKCHEAFRTGLRAFNDPQHPRVVNFSSRLILK